MHRSFLHMLHITLFVQISTTERLRSKCQEIIGTSQCECDPEYYQIRLTCGRKDIDSFTLTIDHNELTVGCSANNPNSFALLSNMSRILGLTKVTIKNCSQDISIQNIAQNVETTELENLMLEDSQLPEPLQYKYFKSFEAITHLTINRTGLTKLENDSFTNLENLTDLEISNNLMKHLPKDVFVALKHLLYLDLSFNHLKDLPPGIFRNQGELIILRLNNNNIRSLTKDIFQGAPAIRELYLDSNKLITLKPDVFSSLADLQNITLSRNYFQSLPEDLFHRNRALRVFKLINDNDFDLLKELPAKLLFDLPYLCYVDIQTGLTSISPDMFQKSRSIRSLRISYTHLTELPYTLFADQMFMESLDLSFNKIKVLPDGIFKNTSFIRTLKLSHNCLYNVPSEILSHLTVLKDLYVDSNNLTNSSLEKFFTTRLVVIDMNFDLRNNSIRSIDFRSIYNYYQRYQSSSYIKSVRIKISHNPFHCDCGTLFYIKLMKERFNGLKIDINRLQCRTPDNLEGEFVDTILNRNLTYPLDNERTTEKLCPLGCSCRVKCIGNQLIVNCSNGGFTNIPSLPRVKHKYKLRKVVHIENNKLRKLPTAETIGYDDVDELHVSNNRLTEISVNNLPKSISFLNLSLNNLKSLNPPLIEVLIENKIRVALSNNPWRCDCSAQYLSKFADKNSFLIPDLKEMICTSGQHFQELTYDDLCLNRNRLIIVISAAVCGLVICLGTLAVLYYKYQQEIKIWLYAHNMMLWFVTEEEIDKNKKYDAFLSYSHKDEDFVKDHLLPGLEQGPTPFKICIHVRDWIIGDWIPNQITRSVDESRRTIIVLSKNFLESVWALMEFRTAHTAALSEGRARVIVIIYGDIGDVDCLDPELKTYLQLNTYAKWGEPWFWDKLRYAMPHRCNSRSRQVNTATEIADSYQLEQL